MLLDILLLKIIIFFLIVILGYLVVPFVLNSISRDIVLVLIILFFFALVAEFFGLTGIIGAYLAGIMVGQTKYGHKYLIEKVEVLGHSFFFPIFFVSIGIAVDIGSVNAKILVFTILATIIAILTKIIGAGAGAKIAGFNLKSSLGIGAGMVTRGEVALIVANIGLNLGIITTKLYTSMIVVTLVTTVITPILLKAIFSE